MLNTNFDNKNINCVFGLDVIKMINITENFCCNSNENVV